MSRFVALQPVTNAHHLQGDLGHTDLQEDLEFHSSSKLPIPFYTHRAAHPTSCRLRKPVQHSQQNPARHCLLPPTPSVQLPIPQTLPLDPLVLRTSLRCRHKRSPPPLHRRRLPPAKLPRRAGRQPRSLRPCVDRYNRSGHPLPHWYHKPVSSTSWERPLCI